MEYADTVIRACDLISAGCSRSRALTVFNELTMIDRRIMSMGYPPRDVLERVEPFWLRNDIPSRAEWLLAVSQRMFPRRRWSFFFIGW